MAKGITSGYVPLGGVGCTEEVVKPIDVFQHLHTYGNHPVSCAAALKNIEIMKKENLIQNSKAMGNYFGRSENPDPSPHRGGSEGYGPCGPPSTSPWTRRPGPLLHGPADQPGQPAKEKG